MRKPGAVDRRGLAGRIRAIRAGRTLKEFAGLIGVSHTSVKRYEEGALPEIGVLLKIAGQGGVDLGRLLTGRPLPSDIRDSSPLHFHLAPSRASAKGFAETAFPPGADGGYVSVPLTEGRVAAAGGIITKENVIDHILLRMKALKELGGSSNLVACRVDGDSMLPYLSSGDIVVIDRDVDRERVMEKKVYAIYTAGQVTANTLQKEGHWLYLAPLNVSDRVRGVDMRRNENPILGLVIGAWRNFEGGIF
ncbi:MAG: helix-turn-helix domain-containing protein [Nitrospinae bacterium]|nr:helix-turn-helix domain-containing protein [Nitrospinota bacterium]